MSERLKSIPRPVSVALTLSLILIVAAGDFLTGPYVDFSFFYLVPVGFAALAFGFRGALLASFAGAVLSRVEMYTDSALGHSLLLLAWGSIAGFAEYAVFAFLIDRILRTLDGLRDLAIRDPLTGAANRRWLAEYWAMTFARLAREKSPVTIVSFDIDHFKRFNDTKGHAEGDAVLAVIAASFISSIHDDDLLVRLGGDEFALVLPGLGFSDSERRVNGLVGRAIAAAAEHRLDVTLSVGAATLTTAPQSVEELLMPADRLLYEAKRLGRARTICAEIRDP